LAIKIIYLFHRYYLESTIYFLINFRSNGWLACLSYKNQGKLGTELLNDEKTQEGKEHPKKPDYLICSVTSIYDARFNFLACLNYSLGVNHSL